jgi:hypothetical protein
MAQLRAKQIKLSNQDDLLIGGASGNGTVLSKGTAGQVLKVLAGGQLGYEKVAAADTTFSDASFTATDVAAALIEAKALASTTAANLATEITDRTNADTALGGRIDDVVADLATEIADRTTAVSAVADDLADEVARATAAEQDLQAQLDALSGGGEGTSLQSLQDEVDAIEDAVGLTSTGAFDETKNAGSAHAGVAAATSVMDTIMAVDTALAAEEAARSAADNALDGRLDTVEADLATAQGDITTLQTDLADEISDRTAADTALQTELDALEVTVGSKADGTANLYANGNYIVQGSAGSAEIPAEGVEGEEGYVPAVPAVPAVAPDNHTVAIGKLDAALKAEEVTRGTAVSTLQAEVDATQAGAGLEVTGAYVAPTGTTYLGSATTLKGADVLLDAAVKANADAIAALSSGGVANLQTEVDAIEAAVGLNANGDLDAYANNGHYAAGATLKAAIEGLDAALTTAESDIATLDARVDALGAAFNYVGLLSGATAGGADAENAFDLSTLPAGGKDAGDYYKVGADGWFKVGEEGEAFFVKSQDGLVFNTTGGVDIIDNTNSKVLAGQNIAVTGSTDTGFTVALSGVVPVANGGTGVAALADLESADEAIVITGGEGAVIAGVSIDLDPSKINFSALGQVGTPADGMFLRWNGTSKQIEYVTAAQLGATVSVEEDYAPAAAANVSFTLDNTPTGDVAVYMNGVKLKKAGYTVSGQTVTLVDSANGYPYEAGDTLSVSYTKAA